MDSEPKQTKEPIFYIEISTATYRSMKGSGLSAVVDRGNINGEFVDHRYDNITVSSALRVFRSIMRLEEIRRNSK